MKKIHVETRWHSGRVARTLQRIGVHPDVEMTRDWCSIWAGQTRWPSSMMQLEDVVDEGGGFDSRSYWQEVNYDRVAIASLRWSCNGGGQNNDRISVLMEMFRSRIVWWFCRSNAAWLGDPGSSRRVGRCADKQTGQGANIRRDILSSCLFLFDHVYLTAPGTPTICLIECLRAL